MNDSASVALRVRLPDRRPTVFSKESALIRSASKGDPAAIEELVKRYWERAQRTAFLILGDATAAEDVAQEAILSALEALPRFDRRRRFQPWLDRIVTNKSLDYRRRAQRRPEVSFELLPGFDPPSGADPTDLDQLRPVLAKALEQLEPEDRAIVVLRHLGEYNAREVGRMLDMPSATVRTRLRRALVRVRDELGEDADGL